MIELLLGVAAYALPLAALPFALRRDPSARRIAVLSLFLAPLAGAATVLILLQEFSVSRLAMVYPFAILPLGFWAALIAALLSPIVHRFHRRSPSKVLPAAAVGGAIVGGLFMFSFAGLASAARDVEKGLLWWPYVASGVAAGMVVGVLAAYETSHRDKAAARRGDAADDANFDGEV